MAMATLRKPLPTYLSEKAVVTISGYFYAVDLGADTRKQVHRVGKDRRCTCPQGTHCPAVAAVTEYLKAGGERAPDPPPGFYPVAPALCPICKAEAVYDPSLGSKHRGAGWRCRQTGSLHYWEVQVQVLAQNLAANPWLFPPVVIRQGAQLYAYDGIEPGDQVLYAGVLRQDVITSE